MSTTADLTIVRGDGFAADLTFDDSQSAYTFTAHTDDDTAFTVNVADDTVTISLTPEQTIALATDVPPYRWWLVRTSVTNPDDISTVASGRIFIP